MRKAKKLIGIVLTLAMVLSMSTAAVAAETDYSITVTNASAGEDYTAYKIFDVTSSGEHYSYTIDSGSAWYNVVSAATDVFTLTQVNGSTTYNVAVNDDVSDDAIVAVFTSAGVPSGATAAASETASGDTVVLYVAEAGYYYVTTSVGTVVSIGTASPNVEIEDKNTPPDVDKKVDEKTTESTENHKTVEYELDIDHIAGNVNVVLHDKMEVTSDQVTYTFGYDGMTVTLIDGDEETPLTEGTDYILVKETDEGHLEDGCAFHVVFTVDGVDYDFSKCSSEAYIEVIIECELDAQGAVFGEDEFTIPNFAMVTYGNAGESTWKEADVYEYGFEVYKYDGEEETPLADAHFTMTNSSGQTAYFLYETGLNYYLLEGWVEDLDDIPEGCTADLVSDEEGMIYIEGLGEATYIITETQAPDGYNMLTSPITVTITADEENPSNFTITVDGEENTGHKVDIANNSGSILPGTGGMGTTIFYVIGVILVLGAAILLITKRRMSNAQ